MKHAIVMKCIKIQKIINVKVTDAITKIDWRNGRSIFNNGNENINCSFFHMQMILMQ